MLTARSVILLFKLCLGLPHSFALFVTDETYYS